MAWRSQASVVGVPLLETHDLTGFAWLRSGGQAEVLALTHRVVFLQHGKLRYWHWDLGTSRWAEVTPVWQKLFLMGWHSQVARAPNRRHATLFLFAVLMFSSCACSPHRACMSPNTRNLVVESQGMGSGLYTCFVFCVSGDPQLVLPAPLDNRPNLAMSCQRLSYSKFT